MRRPKRNRGIKAWPVIHKRKDGYSVDLGTVNGKRKRRYFKTRKEAETYAEQCRIRRSNEGAGLFRLPEESVLMATRCVEKLLPYGATIEQATDWYVERVLRFNQAPKVSELIELKLADVAGKNRRERHLKGLRNRLEKFAETFGERQLASITVEELEQWLNNKAWSARTRINYASHLSQLYRFARKRKWVSSNLTEDVDLPPAEETTPEILPVDECLALLKHAPEVDLLPYIALSLFAGIRSAELQRLDWSAVKMEDREIVIGKDVAKKRSRRVVELNDTLAAWIAPYIKTGGRVTPPSLRRRLNELRELAGLKVWSQNCLRHSFGSYHLAGFGDPNRTSILMGQQDERVFHDHYKALVSRKDAERFWGLRPESGSKKQP